MKNNSTVRESRARFWLIGLAATVVVALACGPISIGGGSQATAEAFAAALEATRAANALTSTAAANATATVKALPPTAGPAPTAIAFSTSTPDAAATAQAEALIAPIKSDLAKYGVNPDQGYLGWMRGGITLELHTYGETAYDADAPLVPTHNFVVQADVTWQTRTGLAGCGYVIHADQSKNFYGMGVARGAEGVAVFAKYRGGRVADWTTFDAPAVNWQNGDTNTLTIVAQDAVFTLYVNGQRTAQVSDGEYAQGITAFAALSESGTSICTFNNGWLWVLD